MKRSRCPEPKAARSKPELPAPAPPRRRDFSRRRAACLLGVHVLIGLHIAHWKIAGRTLAPLELNEVMYTLELGIVTAGAIFMGLVLVSVLVFGRFFCSWGCHVLALQDLCAWGLGKLGIRAKPMRSRFLGLVPFGAMFYMFLWPQLSRVLAGAPPPSLTISNQGWDSFVTEDFWRNLPPPGVMVLSLFAIGFAIVYLLGSRSFCRSVCPYGAVFSLADRVAPGRIVSTGDCESCGACTAGCQSGIRVHEELARYGTVVDPACLKDLDCVAVCPRGSIGYRYTLRGLWRRVRPDAPRIRRQWHFALWEEALLAGLFLVALFTLRGLYGLVPFFLAMALAAMLGFMVVLALRVLRKETLRYGGLELVRAGRRGAAGWGVLALALLSLTLLGHSAWVRHHLRLGERAHGLFLADPTSSAGAEHRDEAQRRFVAVQRIGLFDTPGVGGKLVHLMLSGPAPERAEPYLRALVARAPLDPGARLELGRGLQRMGASRQAEREALRALELLGAPEDPAGRHLLAKALELQGVLLAERGERCGAIESYLGAVHLEPERVHLHLALSELEALEGRYADAARHLGEALSIEPDRAEAQYNLAVLLAQLGDRDGAVRHYGEALRLDPASIEALNNLGFLLAARGEEREADELFRRAIALAPHYAPAHFNLGVLLSRQGRPNEAEPLLQRAAALDERYAQALGRER